MLKHTLYHFGAVVASKVMPLASLLVYSRFLEPAEYGMVSLFFSYIWIFGIALTLNLHTGIGRLIYDKHHNISELVGTTLLAVALSLGIGLTGALLTPKAIGTWLNLPSSSVILLLAVIAGQIAESLLSQILTAWEKSSELFFIIAIRSFGSLATTIALLLLMRDEKYRAVIYAEAVFSLLSVAYLVFILWKDRPWHFSWPVLRAYCIYCIPLIPYMLSLTLLSQFDRVMIDRLIGKEATGLYSVGYNLGILLVMVSSALLNALSPRFFNDMHAGNHDAVRRDGFAVFTACALCAFALALFGPWGAALIIPSAYNDGFALIPLVALGGLASVVFQVWGRLIGYANKTYLLSLVAVVATILKIGLNLLLLPKLGVWGGALTTILAYSFMAIAIVTIINRNGSSPRANVAREVLWLAALAVVVTVERQGELPDIAAWAAKVACFFVAFGLAWPSIRDTFFSADPISAMKSRIAPGKRLS